MTDQVDPARACALNEQEPRQRAQCLPEGRDPGERERAPLLFHDETIIAPHVAAFVAYMGAEPVACAMTLVSHRVAGVFYVATVEHARRRGLGDALTRMAARTGFEMGAGAAWLRASEMGAGLYRRIGFEDLGSTLVELESPPG